MQEYSQVMEMSIAHKGLTRLSVKGDAIQDIFVYPFMVGNVATGDSIQLHKQKRSCVHRS